MSENGPYNQPPQNPYGGGDGTGGQPPFGQPQGGPYGDPGQPGQPGFGQPGGPYPGPGGPGQDQGMYSGGQPPYGPPGGPGGFPPPGQPPQGGGGSKAGLWVVIGGGAIIIVLVIAVVVMLVTNGNEGDEVAAEPDETSQTTDDEEENEPDGSDDEETTTEPDGDAGPAGEPPFEVPTEPCDAVTDEISANFLIADGGDKSVSDNSARCTGRGDAPEGNSDDAAGSLRIVYEVPYTASDSTERAGEDFQRSVDNYTGEGSYSTHEAEHVEESNEIDGLGDEAHYVFTRNDILGDALPFAAVMVRTENLNIRIEYELNDVLGDDEAKAALEMPSDLEDIMVDAAADALNVVGT